MGIESDDESQSDYQSPAGSPHMSPVATPKASGASGFSESPLATPKVAASSTEHDALKQQLAEATKQIEDRDSELADAREKISELKGEMADFSSNLLHDANERVAAANRAAAENVKISESLRKQIRERDILIDGQKDQLDALKHLISNAMDSDHKQVEQRPWQINVNDPEELDQALEYATWNCPNRPEIRFDSYEYSQFLKVCTMHEEDSASTPPSPSRNNSSTSLGTAGASWFRNKTIYSWKFAQRAITEEIEPCLRLDSAPHLSWLARRAFLAAVVEGTLAIEPINQSERVWVLRPSNPCCLCGTATDKGINARMHQIRIPKDSQIYPIGNECVLRVRFACNYLQFLRAIFSGLRKIDTVEAQHAAWLECISLREQLFWTRVGAFWPLEPIPANKSSYIAFASTFKDEPSDENLQEQPAPDHAGDRADQ